LQKGETNNTLSSWLGERSAAQKIFTKGKRGETKLRIKKGERSCIARMTERRKKRRVAPYILTLKTRKEGRGGDFNRKDSQGKRVT